MIKLIKKWVQNFFNKDKPKEIIYKSDPTETLGIVEKMAKKNGHPVLRRRNKKRAKKKALKGI